MNSTKLTVLATLVTATLSMPLAASAQDAGFYLGGSVGRSDTNNDTAAFAALGATVLGSDEKDTGWKLFGGYQFTKNWSVEASYVDLGKFGVTGRIGALPFTASAKVTGYALAAVGTLPVSQNFDLFAKVGIVHSRVKSSATVAAAAAAANDNDTDWTAGIGAKYNVNKNFAIRAEIERYEAGSSGNANLYSIGVQFKF